VLALCALPFRASAEETTSLAVVDVQEVFRRYQKVPDLKLKVDKEFEARLRDAEVEEERLRKESEEIARQRTQVPGDNEQLFDRVQIFQKAQFLLEKKVTKLNEEVAKRNSEEMQTVLNEIRAAISKEAKKGNFQMIMRAADPLDLTKIAENVKDKEEIRKLEEMILPKTVNELVLRFHRNPVLYAAKSVDITEAVIKDLNVEYNSSTLKK
jgi:Skp family chaperone for outer membrane proteins